MIAFTFAFLAFTPFVGVLAQLQTCSDGGAGPCANGLCPMANHRCINTTAGEVCCEESKQCLQDLFETSTAAHPSEQRMAPITSEGGKEETAECSCILTMENQEYPKNVNSTTR